MISADDVSKNFASHHLIDREGQVRDIVIH